MRERKEKEAYDKKQGAEMMQLGLIVLCGAITKKLEKPRVCSAYYVDLTINGRPSRSMVDTGTEVNIINNKVAKRFGMHYNQSNT